MKKYEGDQNQKNEINFTTENEEAIESKFSLIKELRYTWSRIKVILHLSKVEESDESKKYNR